MSLSAGTVTVADDGTVTKSGMAAAIFDALEVEEPFVPLPPAWMAGALTIAEQQAWIDAYNAVTGPVAWKRRHAKTARALAAGIVPYLTANAAVSIAKDAIDTGVPSVNRPTAGTIA